MIITLCGSARFEPWFHLWNEVLSLAGHCVFSLSVYPSWKEGEKNWYSEEEKRTLDQIHVAKIVQSQGVVILNPFAYVGESTLNEIETATIHGKKLYFLESWGKGCGIDEKFSSEVREAAWSSGLIPEGYKSPITTSIYPSVWELLGRAGPRRTALVRKVNFFRRIMKENKALTIADLLNSRDREADLDRLATDFIKNLGRADTEYGSWGQDPKRPFGSSSGIHLDILKVAAPELRTLYQQEATSSEMEEAIENYAHDLYDDLQAHLEKRWDVLVAHGIVKT